MMSHGPRAWWAIRAMRKGEQRSVKMSGELGIIVDLWCGTLGCLLGRRLEARYCLILSMNGCARCAQMSHDPRALWAIRAMRKGEQRSIKMSGELGVTVDLLCGTRGCWWASATRSEVLFDFIYECARCVLMSHGPRAWCI